MTEQEKIALFHSMFMYAIGILTGMLIAIATF